MQGQARIRANAGVAQVAGCIRRFEPAHPRGEDDERPGRGAVPARPEHGKEVNMSSRSEYEQMRRDFRLDVPERFNYARDVVDRWARTDPGKLALVAVEPDGLTARCYTFGAIAGSRQGDHRPVQVPPRDRVRRRSAQDGVGQDPPSPTPRTSHRRRLSAAAHRQAPGADWPESQSRAKWPALCMDRQSEIWASG